MKKGNRVPLRHRIPMTRVKLAIARLFFRATSPFLGSEARIARRGGLAFELDLSEGIDLSLFLFGRFQQHVSDLKYLGIRSDAVVYDVGANIGSTALMFARTFPSGRVFAFEPTDFAFRKLRRNLALNPDLTSRVIPVQAFVSSPTETSVPAEIYSSWRLTGRFESRHRLHGGSKNSAAAAQLLTLDGFTMEKRVEHVDLIKIDTDGYELDVLRGAERILRQHQPTLVFESGLYLMEERGVSFNDYWTLLSSLGYRIRNLKSGREVSPKNFRREIPLNFTTDLLALVG